VPSRINTTVSGILDRQVRNRFHGTLKASAFDEIGGQIDVKAFTRPSLRTTLKTARAVNTTRS
jgi:hypothetical protein